jgi:hypothetical protein
MTPRVIGPASMDAVVRALVGRRWLSKGRKNVVAQSPVQQEFLQNPPQRKHQRHGNENSKERRQTQQGRQHEDQVGPHHDQIAMGEVHQPHDAKD